MKHTIRTLSFGLVLAGSVVFSGAAFADMHNNDPVWGHSGDHIKDARGNCITTNWVNGMNDCHGNFEINQADRTVYFDFNSATLVPEAKFKLNRLVNLVKNSGHILSATIAGYADQIGNAEYNRALSARRARAVQQYLASQGFVETQITTVIAGGEDHPVTSGCGGNKQCLRADRRVEVNFTVQQAAPSGTGFKIGTDHQRVGGKSGYAH